MESGKSSPRRHLKICCFVTTGILVLLIVTLVILYFAVLKPKEPIALAYPVQLNKIDFTLFPILRLNVTLGLLVNINNRNYGSFKYDATTAHVSYRGEIVAEALISADKIPARAKHNVSTSVEILADKLIVNPYFLAEVASGTLNFTSLTTLQGKVNVFNILKLKGTARSFCDIAIYLKLGYADSTCYSKMTM